MILPIDRGVGQWIGHAVSQRAVGFHGGVASQEEVVRPSAQLGLALPFDGLI